AFGGIYPSTLVAPLLAILVLAWRHRARVFETLTRPGLDWALLAVLVAVLVQSLPLPERVIGVVSPAAGRVASAFALVDTGGPTTLTIDLESSGGAALVLFGAILLFSTARSIFETGGVRTVVRSLGTMGLVLSALAIAQDATARG